MIEPGNSLSRNPNICASCSSLADGMEEASIDSIKIRSPMETPMPEKAPVSSKPKPVGAVLEPSEQPCHQGA
jgi:hypothetical protein